ncbi:dipeptide/oligopeptide/nickel ABC transporter permease/ATP-binding protein [Nakamurella lactea]|uniref:dipeptide/oligopeptide/nickel ABC transporter permease/ATP-binding protein n=1 Tax=Nakamurella lactea TaxID=459515 RepID=UPI0004142E82|nr:dipeptide/oligopeptide/nickel ABC transporter permease/ATP-binding protein [Nakamurella lactea]
MASRRLRAIVGAPGTVVGLVILAIVVVVAIIGPAVWQDRAMTMNVMEARQGISASHWLGTDVLGRDVLARILASTRTSLLLALAAVLLGSAIGFPLGAVAGLLPPRGRRLVGRGIGIALAFPGIVTALFICTVIGIGAFGGVLAIGLAMAPGFARLAQTLGTAVAGSDYVAAARVLGVRRGALLRRYVLPNIAEPLLITVTMAASDALIALAALSYLGLGVQPPSYDWGRVLGEGLQDIYTTPAVALGAGAAIVLTGLAFNLLGESMAHGFDSRAGSVSARALRRMGRSLLPGRGLPAAPPEPDGEPRVALRLEDLSVYFPGPDGTLVQPVRGVNLTVGEGEMVGIVGESGSGKSLTALAAAGLVPYPGQVRVQRREIAGSDVATMHPEQLRKLLGTDLAMVFQDPMTSLNPALRLRRQLTEKLEVHEGITRAEATERAILALTDMRITAARRRLDQFPHEMSGGMRQRIMIAMGLMGSPSLLIADEPTTALDVTVQAQIIDLLRALNAEHGTAVVLISHDVSVINELCHRMVVMYGGRIVEQGPTAEVIAAPRHPYTAALLAAVPTLQTGREEPLASIPGQPPSPTAMPAGCPFAPRCAAADATCRQEMPPLIPDGQRDLACWHPLSESDEGRAPGGLASPRVGSPAGRSIPGTRRVRT